MDRVNLKLKLGTLGAGEAFVVAAVVVVTERKTELGLAVVVVVIGRGVKLPNSGFAAVATAFADVAVVVAGLKLNVGSPLKSHYH